MATDAALPFLWGGDGERLTPDAIKRRRAIAEAMAKTGGDYSPIQHPFQGLNRVAQALLGGYESGVLDRAESTNAKASAANVAAMLGQLTGSPDTPAAGAKTVSLDATVPVSGGSSQAPVSRSAVVPPSGSPVVAAPAAKFSGTQDEYLQSMLPAAMEVSAKTGVDPRIIVAQAAIETGYGRSAPGNNHFGIKARASEDGQVLGTKEVVNGQTVSQKAKFRTFDSPADSVAGYGNFLTRNQRYGGLRAAQGLDAQAAALQASGYATDPKYGSKVLSIARALPTPANVAAPGLIDSPSTPDTGQGAPLAYRGQPAPVAADGIIPGSVAPLSSNLTPAVPPQPVVAAAPPAGPRMLLSKERPLYSPEQIAAMTASDPDLPASGAGQADVPAAGSKAAGFFIPPAMDGGEPTIVPTPDDVAPGAQPVQQRAAAVRVAQALNPAAIQALSSPYASDAEKSIAGLLLQKQMQENQRGRWTQETLSDGSIVQRNSNTDEVRVIRQGINPLDQESKRLGIQKAQRELNEPKAPTVQRLKQPDGSEIAMQWDPKQNVWTPLPLPPQDPNAPKPSPKLTEQQSKDLVYYNRGIQALEQFEKTGNAYADPKDRGLSAWLPESLSNLGTSEQFQMSRQSGLNFLASVLRKDSGAAITPNEENVYGRIFLPQPNESAGSLALKKEARRQALEAIRDGLGTAQVLARGEKVMSGDKQAAPSSAPAAPRAQLSRSGYGIPEGARQAPDGNTYVPDPARPGKWLRVVQ